MLFQIFRQSLVLSFEEIRGAKLRSFLSLAGITIGILCIISVRTAVNSLEMNIQNSLASFGNDILYIQKWPWIWADGNDYPWWKYINRPSANRRELEVLQQNIPHAKAACIIFFSGNTSVIYTDRIAEKVGVNGVSYEYNNIKDMEFTQGRYFTPQESNNAQAVAILGANVAETLFEGLGSADGQVVKIKGVKLKVIGVLKKEGSDLFGFTLDNNVIVPFTFMSMFVNMNNENDPLIAIVPKPGVPMDELRYEVRGAMRSVRRLSPIQEDNFAVNQVSVFTQGIAGIFSFINLAGLFIGGFSILVGTFGIANIMFVSVQERVYHIGIKKALGAKKMYILLEFLLESVLLCMMGGLIGLLLVVGIIKFANWWMGDSFHFYLTQENLIIGISISVVTGIIAGFIPAWGAANMRPVDAIRGEVADMFKGIKWLRIFSWTGRIKTVIDMAEKHA